MKNWKKFVADQTIKTEEYYISVPTPYDMFQFRIRYVKHNGYTLIIPTDHQPGEKIPVRIYKEIKPDTVIQNRGGKAYLVTTV